MSGNVKIQGMGPLPLHRGRAGRGAVYGRNLSRSSTWLPLGPQPPSYTSPCAGGGIKRLFLSGTIALLFFATPVWAHGGEDHSHDAPPKPAATLQPTDTSVSRSAVSDQYELVLTVDAATTGAPRQVRLHLSDYATNAPIGDATLAIDWGNDVSTEVKPTDQPGIYAGEVTFPKPGSYSPLVTLHATTGDDLLTFEPLPVTPPGTPAGSEAIPWTYAAGIAAAAAALAWRLTRRKRASQSRPEKSP